MANQHQEPLVTVLTPVYDGEKYLAQCIESVLAQSYQNWEYVIVNNCSKDSTPAIAAEYAARDGRIRVHHNREFVGVIRNHNIAVRQMSSGSKYCKFVHTDDYIFPDCLSRMVRVAETYPTVGLVSSYRLCNDRVDQNDVPFTGSHISGRELCRLFFQKDVYLFGAPTATLIRADLVRKQDPFYNEDNLHADTEACLKVLQESDFGFVHQVLTYSRLHEASVTSRTARPLTTTYLGHLECLVKYGPCCLNEHEFRTELQRWLKIYYRGLARAAQHGHIKALKYNAAGLRRLGYPLNWTRLGTTIVLAGAEVLLLALRHITRRAPESRAGK